MFHLLLGVAGRTDFGVPFRLALIGHFGIGLASVPVGQDRTGLFLDSSAGTIIKFILGQMHRECSDMNCVVFHFRTSGPTLGGG